MKDITRGYTFTDSNSDWDSKKNTAIRLNKMVDDATVNIVAGSNITVVRDSSGINISATAPAPAPGSITASQISSVNASSIIGTITSGQIGSVSAGTITGTITSGQIGSVSAGTIIGTITSSQIGSVSAGTITGTITSSQIGSVSAGTITGSITSGQISSVSAASISGSITSGQIGSVSAGVINGVIVTSQLADQILNTQRLIASDLSVIRRVASNPTLPSANYPSDSIVLNTSNKTLYQNVSGAWTAVTSSSNITGTLTANDISSVNANSITGFIISSQIGSVAATTITGSISSGQISSVSAASITGSITSSQIGSVAASSITGSITSGQISSVSAASITGSITSTQISSVSSSSITGTITSTQIGSINASTITVGLISNGQINSIDAGKITAGTITATVSLESPKIAVAGACYNSASYTGNTFGSTTLTIDDNGATKPSGFDTSSPAYVNITGCKLFGWGHGSYGNRYGRTDPKISVFAVGEFSGIGSGAYASYAIEYSTDGGTNWYQVTAIDASIHNPGTFVSVSGAIELTSMAALGEVIFRFRLSGSIGGNPTFEFGQIQVLCHNF
jgi:hypothetical protein